MAGTILFGDDGSQAADLAWMWINAQSWGDWGIDVLTAQQRWAGPGLQRAASLDAAPAAHPHQPQRCLGNASSGG